MLLGSGKEGRQGVRGGPTSAQGSPLLGQRLCRRASPAAAGAWQPWTLRVQASLMLFSFVFWAYEAKAYESGLAICIFQGGHRVKQRPRAFRLRVHTLLRERPGAVVCGGQSEWGGGSQVSRAGDGSQFPLRSGLVAFTGDRGPCFLGPFSGFLRPRVAHALKPTGPEKPGSRPTLRMTLSRLCP